MKTSNILILEFGLKLVALGILYFCLPYVLAFVGGIPVEMIFNHPFYGVVNFLPLALIFIALIWLVIIIVIKKENLDVR